MSHQKYTSALVNSLAPTDHYTSYQWHCRRANCTQRLRSRTSPACSTSTAGGPMHISAQVQQPSLLSIDLQSTVREQQVQTSNLNIYGQVQSRPEYTLNTCKHVESLCICYNEAGKEILSQACLDNSGSVGLIWYQNCVDAVVGGWDLLSFLYDSLRSVLCPCSTLHLCWKQFLFYIDGRFLMSSSRAFHWRIVGGTSDWWCFCPRVLGAVKVCACLPGRLAYWPWRGGRIDWR